MQSCAAQPAANPWNHRSGYLLNSRSAAFIKRFTAPAETWVFTLELRNVARHRSKADAVLLTPYRSGHLTFMGEFMFNQSSTVNAPRVALERSGRVSRRTRCGC